MAVSFITSGGCQYVKGTKLIFIEVCVVEFGGLNSNFLVFKLHFYTFYCFTVNFTVLFYKRVYSFSVFFTKLFWKLELPQLFCKNYRIVKVCVYIYIYICIYCICILYIFE